VPQQNTPHLCAIKQALCHFVSVLLLSTPSDLQDAVSQHVEVRERRRAAPDEALLLAQNLLSLMVVLEIRFGPRFNNITWHILVAEG
jgi:hypothetical protein